MLRLGEVLLDTSVGLGKLGRLNGVGLEMEAWPVLLGSLELGGHFRAVLN